MDIRKEVLGSNIKRKARIGDKIISILHNGESGAILFFCYFTLDNVVGPMRYNMFIMWYNVLELMMRSSCDYD